jgi:hypothetical protein
MSCQCPEVHDGREWRPQCEALEAGSLASAEAEGPTPQRFWRTAQRSARLGEP